MAMITIRNLDPGVKAKLRERAARNGRSMEAEARALLGEALQSEAPIDLMTLLERCFPKGGVELELPGRSETQRDVEFSS